jgi:hypothetical protein
MGLFGKSEEKDDEGDTPPAIAKKNDDRHLQRQDSEAPSTVCPCACGNRFLDWMKGFIEIKPFKVEPRMAQMRWEHIWAEGPLLYRNRHLGCFLCKHVDPLRACCPAPLQECTFFPMLFPIATQLTFLPFGQAVTSARHEEVHCCGLGAQGCVACSALAWPILICTIPPYPLNLALPVWISWPAAFLTAYQRYKIIKAYGIDDDHLDDYFGDHIGSDACKLALDCCCYPFTAWHQNVFLQEMRAFGHAEEAGDIVVTREPGGV